MVHLNSRLYHVVFLCLLYWPRRGFLYYYYPTIFWSPNNCRFNLNGPAKNEPFHFNIKANSHLFFVCPNHAIWNDMGIKSPHYGRMYENLMLVDEAGFESCSMNKTRDPKMNREIFRCDQDPQKFTYTEEIFASQRAFSEKMRYESGKYYYFISTSDGTMESLSNTNGGHCRTHQMKLKVYVCRKNDTCKFNMPKCPYSNVFAPMPTAKPPKSTDSVLTSSPTSSPARTGISTSTRTSVGVPTQDNRQKNSGVVSNVKEGTPKPKDDEPEPAAQSLSTFSAKDKTHIAIHITMALIILVLFLCLVYLFITRRKTTKTPKTNGTNSRLYQERPISMGLVDSSS